MEIESPIREKPPCKGCEERHEACWGDCEKYKSWKSMLDEVNNCGWYNAMVEKYPKLASTNIQERYDAYNEVFYGND